MNFKLQTLFQKMPWKSLGKNSVVVEHIVIFHAMFRACHSRDSPIILCHTQFTWWRRHIIDRSKGNFGRICSIPNAFVKGINRCFGYSLRTKSFLGWYHLEPSQIILRIFFILMFLIIAFMKSSRNVTLVPFFKFFG